jgi:hypothetical protein
VHWEPGLPLAQGKRGERFRTPLPKADVTDGLDQSC